MDRTVNEISNENIILSHSFTQEIDLVSDRTVGSMLRDDISVLSPDNRESDVLPLVENDVDTAVHQVLKSHRSLQPVRKNPTPVKF